MYALDTFVHYFAYVKLLGVCKLACTGAALSLGSASIALGAGLLVKNTVLAAITGKAYLMLVGAPTLVMAMHQRYRSRLLMMAASLISITSFIFYQNFQISATYAVLWLVPLVCAFFAKPNNFILLLESSFVAHMVGTWVFCASGFVLAPMVWVALIPVACVERLAVVAGALAMQACIKWVKSRVLTTAYAQKVLNFIHA